MYPLARQGVFRTIQGEGVMIGTPMVFVRLAGCNVGCPECDTDYRVHERVDADELTRRVAAVAGNTSWVWVTGGEPTVHDLPPLLSRLHRYGFTAPSRRRGPGRSRSGPPGSTTVGRRSSP